MSRAGVVTHLWRYPVKSMAGEALESARITWRGIPGDRGWAVFDETRGGITNGKRLPALRQCHARYAQEPVAGEASPPVTITFPDGSAVNTEAPDASHRLSAYLGRDVTLRALGPAGSESAPRLVLSDEPEDVIRELSGLLPGEPMPDYSELPPEKLRLLRQGNYFDALPLHVLTGATLETLGRIAPESDWDVRRFRPNVFVEMPGEADYPELAWIGREVRVGDARIAVAMGCPRCVMVTQAVDELPVDHRIMRALVKETRHTAGVYCGVAAEGHVRVGDSIEWPDRA